MKKLLPTVIIIVLVMTEYVIAGDASKEQGRSLQTRSINSNSGKAGHPIPNAYIQIFNENEGGTDSSEESIIDPTPTEVRGRSLGSDLSSNGGGVTSTFIRDGKPSGRNMVSDGSRANRNYGKAGHPIPNAYIEIFNENEGGTDSSEERIIDPTPTEVRGQSLGPGPSSNGGAVTSTFIREEKPSGRNMVSDGNRANRNSGKVRHAIPNAYMQIRPADRQKSSIGRIYWRPIKSR